MTRKKRGAKPIDVEAAKAEAAAVAEAIEKAGEAGLPLIAKRYRPDQKPLKLRKAVNDG